MAVTTLKASFAKVSRELNETIAKLDVETASFSNCTKEHKAAQGKLTKCQASLDKTVDSAQDLTQCKKGWGHFNKTVLVAFCAFGKDTMDALIEVYPNQVPKFKYANLVAQLCPGVAAGSIVEEDDGEPEAAGAQAAGTQDAALLHTTPQAAGDEQAQDQLAGDDESWTTSQEPAVGVAGESADAGQGNDDVAQEL